MLPYYLRFTNMAPLSPILGGIAAVPFLFDALIKSELWSETAPKKGDHIRVSRGVYTHHGLYFSDEEIIHFTGAENDNIWNWQENQVITSTLADFLRDGVLEVRGYTEKEKEMLFSPEEIYEHALESLGTRKYNLFFNNCEHFSNICTLGKRKSKQIRRLFTGRAPVDRGFKSLGLFGDLFVQSVFRNRGNGVKDPSVYEPDVHDVALIVGQTQALTAHLELGRVEYLKNAQLDILTFHANTLISLDQAKAQGFVHMAKQIEELQETFCSVATKRLAFIEQAHLDFVEEMETYYLALEEALQYQPVPTPEVSLPDLLDSLEQYPEGSPEHGQCVEAIEEALVLQVKFRLSQLVSIATRQDVLHDSFLQGEESVLELTSVVTESIMKHIVTQSTAVSESRLLNPAET